MAHLNRIRRHLPQICTSFLSWAVNETALRFELRWPSLMQESPNKIAASSQSPTATINKTNGARSHAAINTINRKFTRFHLERPTLQFAINLCYGGLARARTHGGSQRQGSQRPPTPVSYKAAPTLTDQWHRAFFSLAHVHILLRDAVAAIRSFQQDQG